MWSELQWDPTLNTNENYLKDDEDIQGRADPTAPNNDGKTLLHLIFWLVHTRAGRTFMRGIRLGANGELTAAQEGQLSAEFAARGVTDERIQSALIKAHVAALSWEKAFKGMDPTRDADIERWGKTYLQHTAFITWCLWEDAKGHEFSMTW